MSEPLANALVARRVAEDPDARLVAIPDSFGGWFDLSAQEFHDRVRALAKGFVSAGLAQGDRVGVLCSNRFEVTLVDFATALIGVAVVPIETSSSQSDLQSLLEEAGVVAMVVETARDFAKFDELHGDLPLVGSVWQVALNDLDKLMLAGSDITDDDLAARSDAVTAETPIGVYRVDEGDERRLVTVTHGDLSGRAVAFAVILDDATGVGRSTLLVVPSVDVTARLVALTAVLTGTRLGHLADPARLLPTIATFRPTLLVAPPSAFEQIDQAAHDRAQVSAPALRQALDVALEYAEALDDETVSRGLKTRFALADAIVLRGVRKAAGGRLVDVVSLAGASALPRRLRYLMRALDVRPLEAYGSTATGGIALIERHSDSFDRPDGTVGTPLAGVEASLGADGSLLLRGSGVMVDSGAVAGRAGGNADLAPGGAAAGGRAWLDTGLEAELDASGRVTLVQPDDERHPPAPAR